MLFLLYSRRNATVQPQPHTEVQAAFFLSHPDCNRRLRSLTGSADPAQTVQALAGLFDHIKITAGGEFHPALRIHGKL